MESPDLLEPLPVVVAGVEIAPEPVLSDAHMPPAHVVLDALLATLTEATTVRARPPWSDPVRVPAVASVPARFLASFSRMIAVSPTQLAGLHDWWRAHNRAGTIAVGSRLRLGEPERAAAQVWRIPARLRSPLRVRALPVDFWLWPHLDAWSKCNVEPQRGLHPGRRYFASGHRVLDVLTDRLVREL